jgi:hypothetical protein
MKRTTDITREDIPFGVRASSQIPGWPPGTVRSLPNITPPSRVSGNTPHSTQPAAKGGVVPPAIPKANNVTAGPLGSSNAVPVRTGPAINLPTQVSAAEVRLDSLTRASRGGIGLRGGSGAFDAGNKRR